MDIQRNMWLSIQSPFEKDFDETLWNESEILGDSFKSVRTKTSRQLLAYVPVPKLLSAETDCRPVRARSRLLP